MRRASGLKLIATALALSLVGPFSPRPAPTDGAGAGSPATIEPTLPLAIALEIQDVQRDGRGGTALLAIELDAGPRIRELSTGLILPEGLEAGSIPWPHDPREASLSAGEQRRQSLPMRATREGIFPIRLQASFELEDGRRFSTQQGVTLRVGAPRPEGRLHLGAYEVMGVPLGELRR